MHGVPKKVYTSTMMKSRSIYAQLVVDAPPNFLEQGMFKFPNRWKKRVECTEAM